MESDEYPAKVAAELKDFNIENHMDKKEARKMDRFTQYAVVAAKMAVQDAGLNITDEIAPRVGVWVGSGIGGLETLESQFEIFLTKGPRRVSPFFVPMMIPDMATGQISIALGAKGVNSCTILVRFHTCDRSDSGYAADCIFPACFGVVSKRRQGSKPCNDYSFFTHLVCTSPFFIVPSVLRRRHRHGRFRRRIDMGRHSNTLGTIKKGEVHTR